MDEKASSSQQAQTPSDRTALEENLRVLGEKVGPEQPARVNDKPIPESTEIAASEHRKAYGTAKTENLRDTEAWRFLLPAFVVVLCLAVLAIPLIILIPLFVTSLDVTASTHGLVWLWITMIVIEVFVAVFIIRGIARIFLTQAGNY